MRPQGHAVRAEEHSGRSRTQVAVESDKRLKCVASAGPGT